MILISPIRIKLIRPDWRENFFEDRSVDIEVYPSGVYNQFERMRVYEEGKIRRGI